MTALEGEVHHRRIRLSTATLLVVASMVGTGVFTTTGFWARDVESMVAILIAWIVYLYVSRTGDEKIEPCASN